jgi:guanosine-3',5'-bis(diphosphate) 3'-pyrophosphohydrolase
LSCLPTRCFCFTPKGALIALPKGANAIDFAYAVHTDVGNSCVGCRINGRHAPLMTELSNGDEVEIIRSQAQTPPAAWEKVVRTGKARAAIRRATRLAVRAQYAGLGAEILERQLARFEAVYDAKLASEAFRKLGVVVARRWAGSRWGGVNCWHVTC